MNLGEAVERELRSLQKRLAKRGCSFLVDLPYRIGDTFLGRPAVHFLPTVDFFFDLIPRHHFAYRFTKYNTAHTKLF